MAIPAPVIPFEAIQQSNQNAADMWNALPALGQGVGMALKMSYKRKAEQLAQDFFARNPNPTASQLAALRSEMTRIAPTESQEIAARLDPMIATRQTAQETRRTQGIPEDFPEQIGWSLVLDKILDLEQKGVGIDAARLAQVAEVNKNDPMGVLDWLDKAQAYRDRAMANHGLAPVGMPDDAQASGEGLPNARWEAAPEAQEPGAPAVGPEGAPSPETDAEGLPGARWEDPQAASETDPRWLGGDQVPDEETEAVEGAAGFSGPEAAEKSRGVSDEEKREKEANKFFGFPDEEPAKAKKSFVLDLPDNITSKDFVMAAARLSAEGVPQDVDALLGKLYRSRSIPNNAKAFLAERYAPQIYEAMAKREAELQQLHQQAQAFSAARLGSAYTDALQLRQIRENYKLFMNTLVNLLDYRTDDKGELGMTFGELQQIGRSIETLVGASPLMQSQEGLNIMNAVRAVMSLVGAHVNEGARIEPRQIARQMEGALSKLNGLINGSNQTIASKKLSSDEVGRPLFESTFRTMKRDAYVSPLAGTDWAFWDKAPEGQKSEYSHVLNPADNRDRQLRTAWKSLEYGDTIYSADNPNDRDRVTRHPNDPEGEVQRAKDQASAEAVGARLTRMLNYAHRGGRTTLQNFRPYILRWINDPRLSDEDIEKKIDDLYAKDERKRRGEVD